jgi:hypothetical protein
MHYNYEKSKKLIFFTYEFKISFHIMEPFERSNSDIREKRAPPIEIHDCLN